MNIETTIDKQYVDVENMNLKAIGQVDINWKSKQGTYKAWLMMQNFSNISSSIPFMNLYIKMLTLSLESKVWYL